MLRWPCEPACRQSGGLRSALQSCEALQRERRSCQLAGHRQRDRELLVVAARREVDDLPLARDVCWEVDNGEPLLNEAARRCEAMLFLISKAWLGSTWCKNELNLARRLNKRLFGILIEEALAVGDLPADVTSKWQVINLAAAATTSNSRSRCPSPASWQRRASHGDGSWKSQRCKPA